MIAVALRSALSLGTVLASMQERFRVQGFRGLGFRGLGFRVYGLVL